MEKSRVSGWFLLCILLGIIIVLGHNFYRYYLEKSYIVNAVSVCDPQQHSCFEADPNVPNPDLPIPVYEKIEVTAADAPACLDEHSCPNFSCVNAHGTCTITYCSTDNLEDGEACSSTPH